MAFLAPWRLMLEDLRVDVWQEAADGRGPDDQNGDTDEAVEMNEMAAQRLVRNLFLVTIPDEDLFAHLDVIAAAGAYENHCGIRIQGMPVHVVRGVGDLLLREELPRLGAGGSALSAVEPNGLHRPSRNRLALWPGRPEGRNENSRSIYRS